MVTGSLNNGSTRWSKNNEVTSKLSTDACKYDDTSTLSKDAW